MNNLLSHFFDSSPAIRLILYAIVGCVLEVLFTALVDLLRPSLLSSWNIHSQQPVTSIPPQWRKLRDSRAVGYTFLWMFPLYSLMVLLEPLHDIIRSWPWLARGLIYLIPLWGAELAGGWIIRKITRRCPWDYSYSKFAINRYIRWDYAPIWFTFGFIFEYFHDKFILLTPAIQTVFFSS